MPGFKVEPESVRAFGAAVGELATDAEKAREYATRWLGIGYAEGGMFATVVEQATTVREALEDNYRRLQELVDAAGEELGKAADFYDQAELEELERLDGLYPAPGDIPVLMGDDTSGE